MSTHVVIVGNGIAGMEAALGIRAREPSWPITIVSEESDHFFSRTALMWVHSGQLDHRGIEPYERDLYARKNFTRVRARAVGVDTERELLQLTGNQDALSYDRLIIACGSAPRRGPWPGSDLRGVGHFITLQDLEWFEKEVYGAAVRERPPRADAHLASTTEDSPYLHRETATAKRNRPLERAVVIGGGLVGIEAVEVLRAAGKQVTFVIREDWYWPMAIDGRESAWIAERMREHGVDVRLGENVEAMLGDDDGNVRAVKTDAGEIPTDAVVVAVGVIPNTGWLTGSDIEIDERGGVVVDDSLTTSAANVFAAGDCASVRWHDGTQRPEQLWYTGREQGRVAAAVALGDDARYARGTWFNSAKLMDIEYTTVGQVESDSDRRADWFFEERGEVRSTTRIATKDGRVVGFNLLGRRWDHEVLIGFIEGGLTLAQALDRLHEASFDTEFVPPLVIPNKARNARSAPDGESA
ncbi:MAG: hypothetical protein DRJ42_16915 [Deltaproteobacteria bacterium]|nr:MAG: hypothetical protein DRJ42_16915 [Deltaproteobacteria bacterium]